MYDEIDLAATRGRQHKCKHGLATSIELRRAHGSSRTAYKHFPDHKRSCEQKNAYSNLF